MAWTETLTDAVTGEVAQAAWGDAVNANFAASGPHLIVRKPSDEGPISSTTFQADNDLIAPVGVNEVWLFQYFLRFVAATGGDIKLRWTFPASPVTVALNYVARNVSGLTDFQTQTATSPLTPDVLFAPTNAAYGFTHGPLTLMYVNGANAGSLGLEWAPNTAVNLTMKANSTLWGVKLA